MNERFLTKEKFTKLLNNDSPVIIGTIKPSGLETVVEMDLSLFKSFEDTIKHEGTIEVIYQAVIEHINRRIEEEIKDLCAVTWSVK